MGANYTREEVTTTIVRLKAKAPLDGTTDIYQLLTWARHEVNRDDGYADDLNRDPGYGRIWLEPVGSEGDSDAGIAVCFEQRHTEAIRAAPGDTGQVT